MRLFQANKEIKMNDLFLSGDYAKIAAVQASEEAALINRRNVVGVGVGNKMKDGRETSEPSLVVFVEQKLDADMLTKDDLIPREVGKFKTDVVETGVILAGGQMDMQYAPSTSDVGVQTLRNRVRPVEGGYSVGHYKITAGTMATAVVDAAPFPGIPGRYYMLSNNHVLANSNDARVGDPILQPGPYDGGTSPADIVARLSRFVPIHFDGRCNYVDAAIAEGEFHNLDREIYWIGYTKEVAAPQLGSIVQKTGRTTNYTTGRIIGVNATVNVNYGGGKVAKMCGQIVTTNMSAGGDSGSLLLDMNENAVGLLFAGSATVTIHNDIRSVLRLLGIRLP